MLLHRHFALTMPAWFSCSCITARGHNASRLGQSVMLCPAAHQCLSSSPLLLDVRCCLAFTFALTERFQINYDFWALERQLSLRNACKGSCSSQPSMQQERLGSGPVCHHSSLHLEASLPHTTGSKRNWTFVT